jgi:hypothetical protein
MATNNCLSYDCTDPLGTHLPNECDEELLAGSDAIILFDCNTTLTDPTSPTQINAEIAAGRAHKITGVKIGVNERSAVQIEAKKIGNPQRLINYDQALTIIDANVNPTTVDFYDTLFGGRTFGKAIVNLKGTESNTQHYVLFIDAAINGVGSMPIKNQDDDSIFFTGTLSWRNKKLPTLHNAPAGIF